MAIAQEVSELELKGREREKALQERWVQRYPMLPSRGQALAQQIYKVNKARKGRPETDPNPDPGMDPESSQQQDGNCTTSYGNPGPDLVAGSRKLTPLTLVSDHCKVRPSNNLPEWDPPQTKWVKEIGKIFDEERAKSPGTFLGRKSPVAKERMPTRETLALVQEALIEVWEARMNPSCPPDDPQMLWRMNCLIYAGTGAKHIPMNQCNEPCPQVQEHLLTYYPDWKLQPRGRQRMRKR